MKKEVIRYPDSTHPMGAGHPYPRAVKAGNWIFMTLGNGAGPSFEEQFTGCFEEIKTTLESLGSSMGDIMQMNVFFVNLERDADKAGPIWQKYLPSDRWPIGAWVGIKELLSAKMLVEVTCTAIIPDE